MFGLVRRIFWSKSLDPLSRDVFIGKYKTFLKRNPKTIQTNQVPEQFSSSSLNSSIPIHWFFDVSTEKKKASLHIESTENKYRKTGALKATLNHEGEPNLKLEFVFNNHDFNPTNYRSAFEVKSQIPGTLQEMDPSNIKIFTIDAPLYYQAYLEFLIQKLEECKKYN